MHLRVSGSVATVTRPEGDVVDGVGVAKKCNIRGGGSVATVTRPKGDVVEGVGAAKKCNTHKANLMTQRHERDDVTRNDDVTRVYGLRHDDAT